VQVICHALTHTGAVRPANEDAVAVGDWCAAGLDLARPARRAAALDEGLALVVADGMGGHAGGELASQAAVAAIQAAAGRLQDAESARQILHDVNARLYGLMHSGEGVPGMGTTVAGLALWPDRAVVFNVGDSRVYGFDCAAGLVQLSTDDTPGPRSADGRVALTRTPLMTQALGGAPAFQAIVPHAEDLPPPVPGSCLLLCSDGLSDRVDAERIAGVLRRETGAAAVRALFDAAMAAGGDDNVSILLAEAPSSQSGACR